MSAEEVKGLVDAGDWHGLMAAAVRLWVDRTHPQADHAAVYVWVGDLPATRVTIPLSACAASRHDS